MKKNIAELSYGVLEKKNGWIVSKYKKVGDKHFTVKVKKIVQE